MKAANTRIVKGQNPAKEKGHFPLLSYALTGIIRTGLSGFVCLFLFTASQLSAQPTQLFSTNGIFTVPVGVTSIHIQAWGGGGSSGNNTGGRARGGGGGGAYSEGTITVAPGATITIVAGAGGIYDKNNIASANGGASSAGAILARGGSRGVIGNNSVLNSGAGGTISANPGGVISFNSYAGGNGGNGYVNGNHGGGGGGGASASIAGAGNPGSDGASGGIGGAGGTGNAGGGDGGRGANNDFTPNSTDGVSPGGGGGGRADDHGSNTNGAAGQVIVSWTMPAGYCSGNAISIFNAINVNNSASASGSPDGSGAHLNETGDQLALDLTNGLPLSAGGSVNVTWQRVSDNNSSIKVEVSGNGMAWTAVADYSNINPKNTWITQSIPLPADTRYIRFTSNNGWDLDIDAISYYTPCGAACVAPALFTVTGGGILCSGGGLSVGLSGSETGIEYQLNLGATPQGAPISGTGLALDFGNQSSSGTYAITATRTAGGCTATMNGNAVIANATPAQASVIAGPTTSCSGASLTYNVTNVPGVTYAWTFPAGWTQTGGGTSNSVTVTAASNIGNVTVTPSNACGNGTTRTLAVSTITTMPAQPGSISGPVSPCTASTLLNYSVPNVAGITYNWVIPATWAIMAGQGTSSVSVTAGTAAGNVSVTASNICGTSAAQALAVSIGPKPTPNISANYCYGGGFIQLTANGGGAGATWLWSTDETTQSILVNIAGQYSVEVTNASGCSATANYSVSTELVTNGDFTAGNSGFSASTYGYRADVAGNAELIPEGLYGIGTNAQNYHSNFWGRDHTTGTGNFMIVNGFPGTPQPVIWSTTVTVVPGTAYYFSAWAISLNTAGNYAILQFRVNNTLIGTTAPLPARAQNNNPPFTWVQFYGTWTAPVGVNSVQIDIVDFQTAAAGNDFGLDDISFATLAPLPAVIAPTTNAAHGSALCPGQTLNLFANLTGGKAPFTFSWTGPAGFTSALENPSIPNVSNANAGVYSLTITDGYGCAPVTASTSPAEINPLPACSITGAAMLCPSSTGNNFSGPAGMATYSWSITGNGTISGTNGSNVSVNAGAGCNTSLTLMLTIIDIYGCTSNCQQLIAINDVTAPTFTRPTDITIHKDANCNYIAGVIVTGDVTNEADFCSGGLNATYTDITTITNSCETVIKRTWSLVDLCGNASASQVQTITVNDNTAPVLANPPQRSYCVSNIQEATFNAATTDINPARPDWYTLVKGSTDLDLDPAIYFSDNCTSKTNLVLNWRIDFAASPAPAVAFITGTGQPSAGDQIIFLGDTLDQTNVVHTIRYWLVDQCGNVSQTKTADIVIKPRPGIIKQTL